MEARRREMGDTRPCWTIGRPSPIRCGLARLVLFVVLGHASAATAGTLIGVSFASTLRETTVWSIDPATAEAAPLAASGDLGMNSLSKAPDGQLYTLPRVIGPPPLKLVDPVTGSTSTVLTLSGGAIDIRATAISPAGEMFAVVADTAVTRQLYQIDPSNGDVSLVADLAFGSIQGADFAPDGTLYAWDGVGGLLRIDPASGLASAVSPTHSEVVDIQTLAFAGDGTLYGAGADLYRIEPTDGSYTLIAPIDFGGATDSVRGIAYVPEPGAMTLFVVSWLAVVAALFRPRQGGT
jgi:sugar lactone lactonase YvrE